MGLKEEMTKVAYGLYGHSGRGHGKDKEHWLEGERIVDSIDELVFEKPAEKKAR